jgi:hypothetical protein
MSDHLASLPLRFASMTRRHASTVATSPRSFAASRTHQAISSEERSANDAPLTPPGSRGLVFIGADWPRKLLQHLVVPIQRRGHKRFANTYEKHIIPGFSDYTGGPQNEPPLGPEKSKTWVSTRAAAPLDAAVVLRRICCLKTRETMLRVQSGIPARR